MLLKDALAVFPGTFDPVHKGHVRVLKHAADLFPNVIWAVARDSPKQPMFTVEQRLEMMRRVNTFGNAEVASFS